MPAQNQPIINNRILQVTIRNRQTTVYQGEALFVESLNKKGDFAILGEHTNFISIIEKGIIVGKTDNTKQNIDVAGQAVVKVNKNVVEIYLGLGEEADKIKQTNPLVKS